MFPASSISGTNTLHRVLYLSRATHARRASIEDDIADILATSRRNNRRNAVTGALLACGDWYIQALEGRRIDVDQTLRRIELDRSHTIIRRLSATPVAERSFSQWNMCASVLSPTDDQIIGALNHGGSFDPISLSAVSAMRLLLSVARLQAATMPEP